MLLLFFHFFLFFKATIHTTQVSKYKLILRKVTTKYIFGQYKFAMCHIYLASGNPNKKWGMLHQSPLRDQGNVLIFLKLIRLLKRTGQNRGMAMVFNAFNNISVISWRSVSLMK